LGMSLSNQFMGNLCGDGDTHIRHPRSLLSGGGDTIPVTPAVC